MAEGWVHFHKNKLVGFLLCIGECEGCVSWRAAASLCWPELFLHCVAAVLHDTKIWYDCAPMRENIEASVHCVLLILLIILQATSYIMHYTCDQALFSVSSKSLVPQNGWLFPPVCVSNSCIPADWKEKCWIMFSWQRGFYSLCTSEGCKLSSWLSAEVFLPIVAE